MRKCHLSSALKDVTQTCALTTSRLPDALVGGGVEEDDGENVQVPHAVGPREKGAVDLHGVVAPVPVTFTDLLKIINNTVNTC